MDALACESGAAPDEVDLPIAEDEDFRRGIGWLHAADSCANARNQLLSTEGPGNEYS